MEGAGRIKFLGSRQAIVVLLLVLRTTHLTAWVLSWDIIISPKALRAHCRIASLKGMVFLPIKLRRATTLPFCNRITCVFSICLRSFPHFLILFLLTSLNELARWAGLADC